ncbi:MAG: WbqC family protein [Bacteroidia bacterium]
MTTPAILSLHYLPCIDWFMVFLNQETIIDIHEHYLKQSYRNRCVILSANGPLALTVPVKKKTQKQPMATLEIEYDFDWQKQHWESIRSAYNSSPYFLYYQDYFEKMYSTKPKCLIEWNMKLIETVLQCIKVECTMHFSTQYLKQENNDFRERIHPKREHIFVHPLYMQVFAEKYPFHNNLSVLDLLFNKGPESREYLMELTD